MTRFRKLDPFHFGNMHEERPNNFVLSFVIASVDQESRHSDLVKLIDDRPILQRADDMKFVRPVPAWIINQRKFIEIKAVPTLSCKQLDPRGCYRMTSEALLAKALFDTRANHKNIASHPDIPCSRSFLPVHVS